MGVRNIRGSPGAVLAFFPQLQIRLARFLGRERAGRHLAIRFIGSEYDALVGHMALGQSERTRVLETVVDALPASQQDRESHQDQPVEESCRNQRRIERAASLNEQVAPVALLELGDGFRRSPAADLAAIFPGPVSYT